MRRAFTLIELLVVVSIIALLIAILLPALSNARYMANVTKCQVAIRSIAAVQLSYSIDNKEYFPEGGYRYGSAAGETGGWFQAMQAGARVRTWELFSGGRYDLRPIYYDYMQNNNQEAVMHCPLKSEKFFENNQDDRILSYMMYVSNNYRSKHFYFEDVGGYERLSKTWSPEGEHDAEFTLLASDFVLGDFAPHGLPQYRGALTTHPSTSGSLYEHFAEINDFGGHILDSSQSSPANFADADGSVTTYLVNGDSINDTDTWVINNRGNHRNVMMPRDYAR